MYQRNRRLPLSLTLIVLLASGCGTLHEPGDSGPSYSADMSGTPELVPRYEPRSRYGNPPSYTVLGKTYYVRNSSKGFVERGLASWYGRKFHGRKTSSGEPYNMYDMSAAHKTLPLPTYVQVKNLDNGRSTIVRVNDRGPFKDGRIIDLSYAAASKLGIVESGTARVEIHAIDTENPRQMAEVTRSKPAKHAPAAANGPLYVQVGAFSDINNADRLSAHLRRHNLPPVSIHPGNSNNKTVYRVRLGPINSRQEADALAGRVGGLGYSNAKVVAD